MLAALATTAGAQDRAVELVTTGPESTGSLTEFDAVSISDDGATVAFATTERLVSADEDEQRDVYVRRGGTTTIASHGERNGNLGIATSGPLVSQDGGRVYFTTAEQLVAEDADGTSDVYEWVDGTTRLISGRAADAPGPDADVTIPGRLPPPAGDRIVIQTTERLLPGDGDAASDLYERTTSGLRLLTGATDADVAALDANRALTHVFFETAKDLLASDADSNQADTYMVNGDQLAHVSKAPQAGSGGAGRTWSDLVAADGSRALLVTAEALDAGDGDGAIDVYLWQSDGGVLWLSKPAGGGGCARPACPANSYGGSSDLSRVAFTTPEKLLPADTDDAVDVYAWTAAGLELVSAGPYGGNGAADVAEAVGGRSGKVSADGRGVLFTTAEGIHPEDADAQVDLYERLDNTVQLVSTGEVGASGGVPAGTGTYRAGSDNALFVSSTAFDRSDTDEQLDVYITPPSSIRGRYSLLVSTGRAAYDADFIAASSDGGRVFFRTREQLDGADLDGGRDLYVSRALPAGSGGGPAADTTSPELALTLTRRTFRGANRRARMTARRVPVGTVVNAYVTEPGQVNMTFSKLVRGRRSKGRCVKTTRRVRKALRCTRQIPQRGKLEFQVVAGDNRIRFYGKVGTRRLKPGRYAVFARAYDGAGNRSRIVSATFTVKG